MDIKVISGVVGVVFTFGALFIQVGEALNRLSALEGKSAPDTTIIEQDVADLKSEVAILRTKIEEIKAKNSNPLMR